MAAPSTRIVSLTITEGGYNFHHVTGDFDYVCKVVAHDLKGLSDFLLGTLAQQPGVSGVRSSICLNELKCTGALPLE